MLPRREPDLDARRDIAARVTLSVAAVVSAIVTSLLFLAGGEGPAPEQSVSPAPGGRSVDDGRPSVWESSYSVRFPGCVAMVLWPADETPVALVTRDPRGAVSRVTLADLRAGRVPATVAGERTIGACR